MEQFRIWEYRLAGCNGIGEFEHGGTVTKVTGFASGEDTVIRFMPDCPGLWKYCIRTDLREVTGEFQCTPVESGNHGPVIAEGLHFRYADGSRFLPFGTTCYGWVHQPPEIRAQTLDTFSVSPFNKIRMLLFPKHMVYKENEPTQYP